MRSSYRMIIVSQVPASVSAGRHLLTIFLEQTGRSGPSVDSARSIIRRVQFSCQIPSPDGSFGLYRYLSVHPLVGFLQRFRDGVVGHVDDGVNVGDRRAYREEVEPFTRVKL